MSKDGARARPPGPAHPALPRVSSVRETGGRLETKKQEKKKQASLRFTEKEDEVKEALDVFTDVNLLWRVADAVCRVVVRDRKGRVLKYGSGFLFTHPLVEKSRSTAGKVLMLTAGHVLSSSAAAKHALAEFYVAGRSEPLTCCLDPGAFFHTAAGPLDYAIVAVARPPKVGEKKESPEFNFPVLRLSRRRPTATKTHKILIVQHPEGSPNKKSHCDIIEKIDKRGRVTYKVETRGGSSGAPGVDSTGRVVLIHLFGHFEARVNGGQMMWAILLDLQVLLDAMDRRAAEDDDEDEARRSTEEATALEDESRREAAARLAVAIQQDMEVNQRLCLAQAQIMVDLCNTGRTSCLLYSQKRYVEYKFVEGHSTRFLTSFTTPPPGTDIVNHRPDDIVTYGSRADYF